MSTFAQRFEYARARQHGLGTWQEDSEIAELVGIAASGISAYKARDEAPPAPRTLALAAAMDVDPGWLAFGEASNATPPQGFADWLQRRYPTAPVEPALPAHSPRAARQKLSDEEIDAMPHTPATSKRASGATEKKRKAGGR